MAMTDIELLRLSPHMEDCLIGAAMELMEQGLSKERAYEELARDVWAWKQPAAAEDTVAWHKEVERLGLDPLRPLIKQKRP